MGGLGGEGRRAARAPGGRHGRGGCQRRGGLGIGHAGVGSRLWTLVDRWRLAPGAPRGGGGGREGGLVGRATRGPDTQAGALWAADAPGEARRPGQGRGRAGRQDWR